MGNEENLDKLLFDELKKNFNGEEIIPLPISIKVEHDNLPDIERWKPNE